MNKNQLTSSMLQCLRRAFRLQAQELRSEMLSSLKGKEVVEAREKFNTTLREIDAALKSFNLLEEQTVIGSTQTDSLLDIAVDTLRAGHTDIATALFIQASALPTLQPIEETTLSTYNKCTKCSAMLTSNANFCASCGCSTGDNTLSKVVSAINTENYTVASDLLAALNFLKKG